jgi:hypothetical protein
MRNQCQKKARTSTTVRAVSGMGMGSAHARVIRARSLLNSEIVGGTLTSAVHFGFADPSRTGS